ncbi:MAG TPA: AAA family ATPase [Candidatus Limnocylindrales bacterium]|nr:AAA family ATPase [Candidatus Limnocylindrales bacterium]
MQLSILLLTIDRSGADALTTALARPGHGVTVVADPVDLFASVAGYSLVLIDRVPQPFTVAAVIEELRRDETAAGIPVIAVAQADDIEERIALLESGADDVITKPFDPVELEARVEAVSLRFQRARTASTVPTLASSSIGDPDARRIVSVFSPKGGVGTTTVATNLAVLANERHPKATLLLDLDLSFGQVASHLDLQPKQSILELVRDEAALREPDLFRTYATVHHSGLQVITAPPAPGFASLITGEHIELVLARALEAYEVVLLDAGATLDDRMLAIFARSDTVIVPVIPEIPALNAVHLLLDQLTETGAMGGQTQFVLNSTFARDLLKRGDVEVALGAQVAADLPYDPIAYLKAVNEGVPLVLGSPRSAAAARMRDLADLVFGKVNAAPAAAPAGAAEPKKERRGLFGRR